jgi:outer membrane protein TolC
MKHTLRRGALTAVGLAITIAGAAWPQPVPAQERLSLDVAAAVELAAAHDRGTKMREDEAAAAAHRRQQAAGLFLPKLSLSARYSRVSHVEPGLLSLPGLTSPDEPITLQLGEAVDDQYSLRLALEQPLFTGFTLRRGYQAAAHAEILAEQRVRLERADVRAATQEAYFTLLKARQLQDVTAKLVAALETQLEQMRLLYDAGRATELDVSRVQSRAAAARVSLVQLRGAEDGAHLALTTLLGLPSTTALELVEVLDAVAPESPPATAQLLAEALATRPELAIAQEGAARAAARAGVEGGSLWPQASLRFGYNYERPNSRYFPVRDRFDDSWDLSLLFSWTAWDWGVAYHGKRAAQAEAAAATRNVDEARDAVRLDVERRHREQASATEQVAAARQAVGTAERTHAAAVLLFDVGRIQSLDLLDATTELAQARSDLVQALADARIAWALVQRAAGRD